MSKKRFYTIFSVYILLLFSWYMFIYLPQVQALNEVNTKLNEISQQVAMARRAQINLKNIKARFQKEQQRLQEEKNRFIRKNDLGKVTQTLRTTANKYDLKLTDFSPGFKEYFDAQKNSIVPLSLSISFIGRYIQIGKFIESWGELPFYLIPEELTLQKLDNNGYDIQAVIEAKLYTWNE
ncbi:hypothetical protein DRI50_08010 [candidate division KSB1 bacterium]|nr:MAG: hypothetical protein DRI50_08010 [candidate division KSB1 bacterium]